MDSDAAIARSHLHLKTHLEDLVRLLAVFDRLVATKLSEELYFQCRLALAEGFTNAVRHAHRDLPEETTIAVEIVLSHCWLEIQIWDRGEQFNLAAKLQEIQQAPNNPLKVGEWGLQWMDELMDEVRYIRENQGNCLILRKFLRDGDRRS